MELSLGMNSLTPDHHFYVDQGTNARLRIVLIAIGDKLVEAGVLDDPEDVMYLRYNELRRLMADQAAFDAPSWCPTAATPARRPPSGVHPRGSAPPKTALEFPYNALWGFPEKFYAGEPATTGRFTAWPPLPAWSRDPRASSPPWTSSIRFSTARSSSVG